MRKIFLFNIVIFFIIIFSLEVIARIFHLADLTGISKNLIVVDNDIHKNAKNVEAYAFSKKVFTDSLGFRIPKKNFNYKDKNSSVLIIGDSVSFGVGVKEQNTFVGLMRNEFKNLNFFNSSVSGYNFKDYSEVAKKNKNLLGLENILLFFTLNDISYKKTVFDTEIHLSRDQVDEHIEFLNKLKSNRILLKINFFLRSKSVFYMWIKGITSKPSERHFYYTYPIYKNTSSVEILTFEIEKLKKVIKDSNLKLNIIVLPYEFQTRKKNCNNDFLIPQLEVKNILNNLNINFVDCTKTFCNYEKPNTLFLKYDPVHLSPLGHEFVFNLLKKDINYLDN